MTTPDNAPDHFSRPPREETQESGRLFDEFDLNDENTERIAPTSPPPHVEPTPPSQGVDNSPLPEDESSIVRSPVWLPATHRNSEPDNAPDPSRPGNSDVEPFFAPGDDTSEHPSLLPNTSDANRRGPDAVDAPESSHPWWTGNIDDGPFPAPPARVPAKPKPSEVAPAPASGNAPAEAPSPVIIPPMANARTAIVRRANLAGAPESAQSRMRALVSAAAAGALSLKATVAKGRAQVGKLRNVDLKGAKDAKDKTVNALRSTGAVAARAFNLKPTFEDGRDLVGKIDFTGWIKDPKAAAGNLNRGAIRGLNYTTGLIGEALGHVGERWHDASPGKRKVIYVLGGVAAFATVMGVAGLIETDHVATVADGINGSTGTTGGAGGHAADTLNNGHPASGIDGSSAASQAPQAPQTSGAREVVIKAPKNGHADNVSLEIQSTYHTSKSETARLVEQARHLNPGVDLDHVKIGQHINIPADVAPTAPATPAAPGQGHNVLPTQAPDGGVQVDVIGSYNPRTHTGGTLSSSALHYLKDHHIKLTVGEFHKLMPHFEAYDQMQHTAQGLPVYNTNSMPANYRPFMPTPDMIAEWQRNLNDANSRVN